MLMAMDCSNHVPVKRSELAEKPLAEMTPQQVARAFVADTRLTIEKGFFEYATPERMAKVWKKLHEMAENGNMRAINAILKLCVRPASNEDEKKSEDRAPIVFQFNAAEVSAKKVPNEVKVEMAVTGGDGQDAGNGEGGGAA